MRIKVIVKPNARTNSVVKMDDGAFSVRIAVPPVDGRANEKLVEVLAEYFNRPKRFVSIIHGAGSRIKTVEIQ